ncbi:MAG: circularly permuted type 2 ATP-grasp protein, partial [Vicinamibacterales bacterium]
MFTADRETFDEMGPLDAIRPAYQEIRRWLDETPHDVFDLKRRQAEVLFLRLGITFTVYSEEGDPERLIPFDIIPRVLSAGEWQRLSRGLQ